MKTITIDQLRELATSANWTRKAAFEIVNNDGRTATFTNDDGEEDQEFIPGGYGFATLTSTHALTSTHDGITITFEESFNFDENEPDSLDASTEGQDKIWAISGAQVVDSDGDVVPHRELGYYLPEAFRKIDYTGVVAKETTIIDIDLDDETMDTFTLIIDNAPNLRFTGVEVATVASSENNASGMYSGTPGRWTELSIYKTKGGKFVCHQIGRTIWQGEHTRFTGKVCETLEEVKEFFGHRWLAKALYEEAGIDAAQDVE